jgi:hypothetical protein
VSREEAMPKAAEATDSAWPCVRANKGTDKAKRDKKNYKNYKN